MRVVSVVGARPQFVKLAPMSAALEAANVDHVIVHTGQHYDPRMSEDLFEDLKIPKPDVHLGVGSATHGEQTGTILTRVEPVLAELAPEWVLVYGDTNSTLASAIASVKLHLPVAHLEAGLRSSNRRMPEEHNRVLTDHAADLCLAPTDLAMRNLEREGLGDRSNLVGDVMTDICNAVRDQVLANPIQVDGVDSTSPFVVATLHRAENTDDPRRLSLLVDRLARLSIPTVLAVHPRLQSRADAYGIRLDQGALRPVPPLPYRAMVSAVLQSSGVITDSGGLQKEAFLLGRPCTTVRTETEWPETLVGGWNILDPDADALDRLAVRTAPSQSRIAPYGSGDAAEQVVERLFHALGPVAAR